MGNLNTISLTAVIGGSGFAELKGFSVYDQKEVTTPYGKPSAPLIFGQLDGKEIVFLQRHGTHHTIAPHKINYRANIYALKACGVTKVIAFAAVGGIGSRCIPQAIVFPDQIIDYTWGRDHTYFDGIGCHSKFSDGKLQHLDFTYPYDECLRTGLIESAKAARIAAIDDAVYGVTQGPRLETAAEINKLERDGVEVVGMTGMPEASLARELDIAYATIAMVVNEGAGRGQELITMTAIRETLKSTTEKAMIILRGFI